MITSRDHWRYFAITCWTGRHSNADIIICFNSAGSYYTIYMFQIIYMTTNKILSAFQHRFGCIKVCNITIALTDTLTIMCYTCTCESVPIYCAVTKSLAKITSSSILLWDILVLQQSLPLHVPWSFLFIPFPAINRYNPSVNTCVTSVNTMKILWS